MLGPTEKAIHVVGKTTFVIVVLAFVAIIGFGIHNIKKLGERRQRLQEMCDRISDARALNRPEPVEKEGFLDAIKGDWERKGRPQPLRSKTFYR